MKFAVALAFLFFTIVPIIPAQQLYGARTKSKFGFIDIHGNWVIPAEYTKIGAFHEGLARVMFSNELWTYVDEQGHRICDEKISKAKDFVNGTARIKVRGDYGLIDKNGKWIIQPQFSRLEIFYDGIALARKKGWGFIDEKGSWVIQPEFEKLRAFSEGLAQAKANGKWGYIDIKGVWVWPATFTHAEKFIEGVACVETPDGEWTVIYRDGHRIKGNHFEHIRDFNNGIARAKQKGMWGLIDKNGDWIAEPKFQNIEAFVNGFARARANNLFGFINEKGEWIIKPQYESVKNFSEGVAQAKSGLWGYINKKGEWIIKPVFQNAEKFINGYAVVRQDGDWGIIDTTGKFAVLPKFSYIFSAAEDSNDNVTDDPGNDDGDKNDDGN